MLALDFLEQSGIYLRFPGLRPLLSCPESEVSGPSASAFLPGVRNSGELSMAPRLLGAIRSNRTKATLRRSFRCHAFNHPHDQAVRGKEIVNHVDRSTAV